MSLPQTLAVQVSPPVLSPQVNLYRGDEHVIKKTRSHPVTHRIAIGTVLGSRYFAQFAFSTHLAANAR